MYVLITKAMPLAKAIEDASKSNLGISPLIYENSNI
jgi:hypothetical protein